ncbi:hypothetical protein L3Q82_016764, partial [Scortum barcoo]
PITTKPVLIGNSTWNSSNKSCTVLLECIATSEGNVTCTTGPEILPSIAAPSFGLILGLAVGGCVLVVLTVGIVVGVCHSKHSRTGSDSNDLTVYADISEVAIEDGTSPNMKPCSVYETIDNRVNTGTPGMINHPQTVYDKIQLSRVRKPSVSPYQEIA